jgi:probable rRNA maturation factor
MRNRQKKRINLKEIETIASRILRLLGKEEMELSISFVNDTSIRQLNRKYFASYRSTDVIAFPMKDENLLGDVVISVDRALTQAREYSQPFKKELIRLIIHGILHLTGFTDTETSERMRMEKRQETILSLVYETA